jgi:hypothetical protein
MRENNKNNYNPSLELVHTNLPVNSGVLTEDVYKNYRT